MKASLKLGSIAGIEIGVHFTWFAAFILIAWTLASGYYPTLYEGWSQGLYWGVGLVSALFLFVSVLVHELAHSFMALARGMPVHSITLFIFGGVSNLRSDASRARDEFVIAIVGPLTSLVLAGVFGGIYYFIPDTGSPAAAFFGYLAIVNGLLAAFNLLPGYPLDGGRVLRSLVWGRTGSIVRATNVSARVGQVFGWGLIAFGVYQILQGNFLGGLWMALIGWFLSSIAEANRRETALQETFRDIKVRDVMEADPPTVEPGTSVQEVVYDLLLRQGRRAVPVYYGNRLLGIISVTDIREVPQDQWATTAVTQVMTREPLRAVGPDDDLTAALSMMSEHDINQVLVTLDSQLVGMLNRSHVMRYLNSREELGLSGRRR